jgi:hypothetical protein
MNTRELQKQGMYIQLEFNGKGSFNTRKELRQVPQTPSIFTKNIHDHDHFVTSLLPSPSLKEVRFSGWIAA